MLFIQCKGAHLFTNGVWNVGNDISYGLKCIFYNMFAIRCRIAINVVGFVEFYGRLCSLFHWIYFTVQLKKTLES